MTFQEAQQTMTPDQIRFEIQRGGRFVLFQYCVSILVMTFKRNSPVYFIKSGGSTMGPALPWMLLSALLGWWGIPWGFIYTPQVLIKNFRGGVDLTDRVLAQMGGGTPPLR